VPELDNYRSGMDKNLAKKPADTTLLGEKFHLELAQGNYLNVQIKGKSVFCHNGSK